MFIRAVHLRNFRSFKTAQTVEFGEKNIIVGKNGSGKSNLLAAIASVFLQDSETQPQYGGDEGVSSVRVDVDNHERRFPLGRYFTLAATWQLGRVEYSIDGRVASREELRGLMENAGLTRGNIVMQGRITEISDMTPAERYDFIGAVAGTVRYEECRERALRCLNDDGEARILDMLDKIDLKTEKTEEHRRRQKEYAALKEQKAQIEYNLMCLEVGELTQSIESMVIGEKVEESEIDENLLDFELKETRDRMCRKRAEVEELRQYLSRYDRLLAECGISLDKVGNEGAGTAGGDAQALRMPGDCHCVNIYAGKVDEIRQRRERALAAYSKLQADERELFIYLKARQYFDAASGATEDVGALEAQLRTKRLELEDCKSGAKSKENVQDLMAARKSLWIKEKMYKDELAGLKEAESSLSNRILYLGKQSINIYESIKSEKGVLGTVYSLFSVPDEIYDAYEAVTRNSLFWIVVENDEIATRLVEAVEGRVTFVALNIINGHGGDNGGKNAAISDDRLIRLSDSVRCDERYRRVLDYVCRGFYICADIKLGVQLSAQYGVSVVSMEGDVVNANGVITGGYEQSQSVLRELKQCTAKISKVERALGALAGQIKDIGERIQLLNEAGDDDGRICDNIKAVVIYLEWKIARCKNGTAQVPPGDAGIVDREYRCITGRLPTSKYELEQLDGELARYTAKKEKVDQIVEKVERVFLLSKEISAEREREKSLIEKCYSRQNLAPESSSIAAEAKRQHKHLLIDKRSALAKKLGLTDFRNIQATGDRAGLSHELKSVNERMKKYYGCDKLELVGGENQGLREKLKGLQDNKARIFAFIDHLDARKEDTFKLTFSMVSANYSQYFKMVTGRYSELVLDPDSCSVAIGMDGSIVDVRSMSGGQRTVIALCLLFAVQRNDPSPFYIFDEVDANLDASYRARIYEVLKEETAQYFITSFKEECLVCGDKFYGVAIGNKESYVGEIDYSLALETVKY